MLVCWWGQFDWSFARLLATVVTTASVILSSDRIQNGGMLVSAYPGPLGKWALKWRDRTDMETTLYTISDLCG